uniref:Uncharacterized protein n=1 Tax=Timema cristinae TaxID=61476 RepID=A0A7R9DNH0_TIMCR|nr:unnamed protein product [Timema cristinae]
MNGLCPCQSEHSTLPSCNTSCSPSAVHHRLESLTVGVLDLGEIAPRISASRRILLSVANILYINHLLHILK